MTDLNTKELQDKADENLAAQAIRMGLVRGWRSVAQDVGFLVIIHTMLSYFIVTELPDAGVKMLFCSPLVIAVIFWVQGILLAGRAERSFKKLPIWERHRINLIMEKLADRGDTL